MSDLFSAGLSQHFIAQLEGDALMGAFDPSMSIRPARVSFVSRNRVRLLDLPADLPPALLPARLCTPEDPVVVGDWVVVDLSGDPPLVSHRLDRKSVLRRRASGSSRVGVQPVAANVDLGLVCTAVGADFSVRRAERWMAVCHEAEVEPLLVLTKADPGLEAVWQPFLDQLAALPGADVLAVSALHGDGVDVLAARIADAHRTASLLGSSGVGKSTLLNALVGTALLATQAVREGDDKGRHTTTHREMVRLPGGGLLIDNPGVREVGLVDGAGLDAVFADIDALTEHCRFRDCQHDGDIGCAVHDAIEAGELDAGRWRSWLKLQREAAFEARRHDRAAQAAEQRKWKRISQMNRARYRFEGKGRK